MAHYVVADEIQAMDFRSTDAAKLNGWFREYLRQKGVTEADVGKPLDQVEYPAKAMYEKTLPREADLATRKLTQLQPPTNGGRALNAVFDTPFVRVTDGRTKVFFIGETFGSGGGGVATLFVYDLASQTTHVVDDGRPGTRDYMVDRTGNEVAESIWTDGKWRVRVKVAGAWRTLPASAQPDGPPAMVGLGPAGQGVLFIGTIEGKSG